MLNKQVKRLIFKSKKMIATAKRIAIVEEYYFSSKLTLKIIDKKASISDLTEADFVILAVPVDIALVLLQSVLDAINDDALVFDVGSIKFPICDAISNHSKRSNFMATHPIAGTEFSGQTAAISGLFLGKTNIIARLKKQHLNCNKKH
jgi:prephenate dehydrogenase